MASTNGCFNCEDQKNPLNLISWEEIYKNWAEKQFEINSEAKIRVKIKDKRKEEDGQASSLAPTAPDRLDLFCRS